MTIPGNRLLIVDDEAAHMRALCDTLQLEGYATTGFTAGKDALAALREGEFDLLLTDLMMPEMDGISLLRAALELDKTLVGIVMTGQGTISTAVDAMKIGALDYVLKPFKLSVVLLAISRALNVRRLRLENVQLLETVAIYQLSMAIGFALDSPTIIRKTAAAIFEQGDAAAVSMLMAEAGGKELYAAAALGRNADSVLDRRVPVTDAFSRWVEGFEKVWARSEELTDLQPMPASGLDEIANGVSIPMLAAGKLIGVLNFSPKRSGRAVPAGRIKSLNILAGTAASALHAASLLEELRTAEQRYRLLADNAPDVIFRYELLPQRRCVYVSPSVTALTGHKAEDFYADPDLSVNVVHPEDRKLLESMFRGELKVNTITLRWISADGAVSWIEQRIVLARDKEGRVAAVEGIARDITERMKLEDQLRQAQRMEAIGRLAAGVAHDFNNILTVINGYTELVLDDMTAESPAWLNLEEVRKAGDRAAALTRQLLAFGRKQILQPRVLNINELLKSYSKMLGRVIGEDIELVTILDKALGKVQADQGQLEQVLMNLAINSRDAMPQGGKLTIETHNVVLDDTYSQGHADISAGSYVMLSVSDTGCGMDAATRSRIFEPFFTTKEHGRGTGLGLSIVYGIVKQSSGNVWVYSEPGKGTTFKIYLPRTEQPVEAVQSTTTPNKSPRGSEALLVVEDDAVVRQLTCMVLRNAGYQVLETKDVRDALNLLQIHKDQIRLVLTDLVMPELGGLALFQKMREISPGIKVLYTSGYSDEVIVRHGHLEEGAPFIQKPFRAGDLLEKIRRTLDFG